MRLLGTGLCSCTALLVTALGSQLGCGGRTAITSGLLDHEGWDELAIPSTKSKVAFSVASPSSFERNGSDANACVLTGAARSARAGVIFEGVLAELIGPTQRVVLAAAFHPRSHDTSPHYEKVKLRRTRPDDVQILIDVRETDGVVIIDDDRGTTEYCLRLGFRNHQLATVTFDAYFRMAP